MFDKIVNFFKNKRKVTVLLPRDDRSIGCFDLPVEDRYIVDEKDSRSWGLRSSMLMSYEGKPCLMVIEHDCSPISLNGEKWDPEFEAIAAEAYDKRLMKIEKEGIKAKAQHFILMIMLVPAMGFILVLLTGLIKSGNLRLPFGG